MIQTRTSLLKELNSLKRSLEKNQSIIILTDDMFVLYELHAYLLKHKKTLSFIDYQPLLNSTADYFLFLDLTGNIFLEHNQLLKRLFFQQQRILVTTRDAKLAKQLREQEHLTMFEFQQLTSLLRHVLFEEIGHRETVIPGDQLLAATELFENIFNMQHLHQSHNYARWRTSVNLEPFQCRLLLIRLFYQIRYRPNNLHLFKELALLDAQVTAIYRTKQFALIETILYLVYCFLQRG